MSVNGIDCSASERHYCSVFENLGLEEYQTYYSMPEILLGLEEYQTYRLLEEAF